MKRYLFIIALALGFAGSVTAQITAPAETVSSTENPDAKYLAPIPEEADGHVYLERILTLPAGSDIDDTFTKLNDWIDRCMKDERIHSHTRLETADPYTYSLAIQQEIIFSKGLLALDKADINYVLEVSLKDNQMKLRMRRISYRYNGDNPNRKLIRISAEDYISDKNALNKRKDKMIIGLRKFRIKTIDLIDEYAASLKMAFWIK